jgi:radical SAM protein with 4Fe4S-binding SPASM domain
METASYSEFSLKLHRRVAAERVPANGTIEVTRRCPLNCAHCYNNLPIEDREARRRELTCEEHCRILDGISETGCLWLLFTGGEIFAREDFLDIYTYGKKKGFLITLFTNGTLITPGIADHLTEWRPFCIEITLYGRTREIHEKITGVPGSFEQCMRGICLLVERKLPLRLKTVVMTLNKQEVWEMKRYTEEELGLEFKFDAMINPRIDASEGPLEVRLKPGEIVELDLQDPKRMAEWNRFAERFNGPVQSPECWDNAYHCGGGIHAFSIDPYGKMSLCLLSRDESYDLRKGSFLEGWKGFLSDVRQKKVKTLTKCVSCEIKAMCGMCPANGELENRELGNTDSETPVDFLCQVAHLRAQALGLRVKPHGECEYCEGGSRHEELMRSCGALQTTRG